MSSRQDLKELAEKEYFHLQAMIQKFDDSCLLIKNWSVTVGMIGIGSSYVYDNSNLIILSSLASLLFWHIELMWKTFQYKNRARAVKIEHFLSGTYNYLNVPGLYSNWAEQESAYGLFYYLKIAFRRHICTPHIFIVLYPLFYFSDRIMKLLYNAVSYVGQRF